MSVDPSFTAATASQQYAASVLARRARAEVGPSPLSVNAQPPADLEKATKTPQENDQKDAEEQVIPHNNMPVVFTGLSLTLFLAALDGTIVAIAMPTIVDDLGSSSGFSWIASSYLLATACVGPLCGKLSDIVGRKPILYTSIILFLLGSALCGAAQNIGWLIASRALQGLGGGGLMQIVMTIVADIVPLRDRAMYGGFLASIIGASSVLGPLIGGVLTQHLSWRWCFWINLPTGGIAMGIVFFSLNLNPIQKKSIKEILKTFDFLGLFLVTAGVILLLVGFQETETAKNGWRAPQTIAPLVAGCLLFILGALNELYTSREPILPARLFKTRTTTCIMLGMFIQTTTAQCVSYYVPLYFQILGSSATISGIKQLPVSFGSTLVSVGVGILIKKTGMYRPIMWVGYAIMTLGYGLMITFEENTPTWKQEVILMVTGTGIGCLYEPPYVGLQAAMPPKDIATTIAAASLVRLLGGAIGVSIGDSIFATELNKRLARISNVSSYGLDTNGGSTGYAGLSQIQPASLRSEVLHAYTRSLSTIWIVSCPLACFGLLCVLLVKNYSLDRPVKREDEKQALARSNRNPGEAPENLEVKKVGARNPVQEHETSSEYFDANDGTDGVSTRKRQSPHRRPLWRIRIFDPIGSLLQQILHFMRELVTFIAHHVPYD